MIPAIQVVTKPIEYYKAFLDMPKPPTSVVLKGHWDLNNVVEQIRADLQITGKFTITNVEREPILNRIVVCWSDESNEVTDHACRLNHVSELMQLSSSRPLVIEVINEHYGNTLQMTPATAQMVASGFYIVYQGHMYRADKRNNINLLYALYSEFYFLKFGGLPTEEGEMRMSIPGTRMAFFYKQSNWEQLMVKYGV